MGQKIHPIGFRVGITKSHQSQWYARFHKYQYSQSILEDHILRKTVMKLFGGNSPELLQSSLKLKKKSGENTPLTPKMTQIKIERGLIPYEIGIQIHAGHCDLIKSTIDQLKMNQTLTHQLQKTRCYIIDLKRKLNEVLKWKRVFPSKTLKKPVSKRVFSNPKLLQQRLRKHQGIKRNFRQSILNQLGMVKKGKTLIRKFQLSRSLTLKKGVQRKQGKSTFKKLTSPFGSLTPKVLIATHSENQEVDNKNLQTRTASNSKINKQEGSTLSADFMAGSQLKTKDKSFEASPNIEYAKFNKSVKSVSQLNIKKETVISKTQLNSQNIAQNPKFITVFYNQMNKLFLKEFQKQMKHWNEYLLILQEEQRRKKFTVDPSTLTETDTQHFRSKVCLAPLGYNRKWSLNRLNRLKKQTIPVLRQLVKYLQSKALLKLDILREEFLVLGYLLKTQSFDYFQMIRFIKNLKLLVKKLTKEQLKQKKAKNIGALAYEVTNTFGVREASPQIGDDFGRTKVPFFAKQVDDKESGKEISQYENRQNMIIKQQRIEKWISSLSEKALKSKLENIDTECRKFKFISYLKEVVKNHRKNHLYYYLATLADSRKSLEKIQKFQKKNAYFLFGVDSRLKKNEEDSGKIEWIQEQIRKSYLQIGTKSDVAKNLPETFVDQLQKKKNMYQENLQFIPKIVIKFYNVEQSHFESKASLVADSIVDDLEKRKVFRRVIKQAKETLMTNSGVKGVKIQVSGRLNGAEMARTEWVRSGRVPLQTLRANIDYSYKTASTIYGIIGVKVWIYKGYAKKKKTIASVA